MYDVGLVVPWQNVAEVEASGIVRMFDEISSELVNGLGAPVCQQITLEDGEDHQALDLRLREAMHDGARVFIVVVGVDSQLAATVAEILYVWAPIVLAVPMSRRSILACSGSPTRPVLLAGVGDGGLKNAAEMAYHFARRQDPELFEALRIHRSRRIPPLAASTATAT